MSGAEISAGHAVFLQLATAMVQAIVSVSLLAWYVLAAHLDRVRVRRERSEDFDSLVMLCRDLGIEAKNKTEAHRRAAATIASGSPVSNVAIRTTLAAWKSDMTVIYVCLNEVPHYEVRNPAFSTALTRLWIEVDARATDPSRFERADQMLQFLDEKFTRICREVDAMAILLQERPRAGSYVRRQSVGAAKRRGKIYAASGAVEEEIERISAGVPSQVCAT